MEGRGRLSFFWKTVLKSQGIEQLADSPEFRRSFAYVLLKPDVFLRGVVGRALDALDNLGFDVVEFRIGQLSEQHFARMYGARFRWDLDHWVYNLAAYRFGPVIGVLLRRRFEDAIGAQEYLGNIKGSALPESLHRDSLRGQLGATGRVFNVMHVPDDFKAALSDASNWLGASHVRKILGGSGLKCSRIPLEEEVSRHGYTMASGLNGEAIYFLVMVRLAHAIEKLTEPHVEELTDAVKALSVLCRTGAARLIDASAKFEERQAIVKETVEQIRFAVTRLRRAAAEAAKPVPAANLLDQTLAFTLDLGSRGLESEWRLDFFWHLLAEWGVFVSDLERYLVLGVLIYPSPLSGLAPASGEARVDRNSEPKK